MGVQGLWPLLQPAGQPIRLESLAGKRLAIDASIWLNQFLKAMRDSEGNMLRNAHLLGFFKRICKLLFYKIKPVFVFDGMAPAIKQKTLSERRRRQDRTVTNFKKTAEKLLSNRLRAQALESVKGKGKGKTTSGEPEVEETEEASGSAIDGATVAKRKRDTFELDTAVATTSTGAQDDEDDQAFPSFSLRSRFNDDYKGEFRFIIDEEGAKVDIHSAEFATLPALIQHEIVAELTVRSRETSWKRLRAQLEHATTASDFSLLQIKNTVHRSELWNKMDSVRDALREENSVAGAQSNRIVSEDAKEYILAKDKKASALLDHLKSQRDAEDSFASSIATLDPDEQERLLEEKRRQEERDAEEKKAASAKLKEEQSYMFPPRGLFAPFVGAGSAASALLTSATSDRATEAPKKLEQQYDDDEILAAALQQEEYENAEAQATDDPLPTFTTSSRILASNEAKRINVDSDDESDVDEPPLMPHSADTIQMFVKQIAPSFLSAVPTLKDDMLGLSKTPAHLLNTRLAEAVVRKQRFEDEQNESGRLAMVLFQDCIEALLATCDEEDDDIGVEDTSSQITKPASSPPPTIVVVKHQPSTLTMSSPVASQRRRIIQDEEDEDEDEGEEEDNDVRLHKALPPKYIAEEEDELRRAIALSLQQTTSSSSSPSRPPPSSSFRPLQVYPADANTTDENADELAQAIAMSLEEEAPKDDASDDDRVDEDDFDKARALSLTVVPSAAASSSSASASSSSASASSLSSSVGSMPIADSDADLRSFLKTVNSSNVDVTRLQRDLDGEYKELGDQLRKDQRNMSSVTDDMIADTQLLLRLFGIPYIVAPSEAEAQCATLEKLKLVDGTVTDDADALLFGAQIVYRNLFNQNKHVEMFAISNIEKDMGLNQDRLIQMAYLLGSDYTDGLTGVGGVWAFEILKEFPGSDGLKVFANWWRNVYENGLGESSGTNEFQRQFIRSKKKLYIRPEFPDPRVKEAYINPTVDDSNEPFVHMMPDLDRLRSFVADRFQWDKTKADEHLLPVMRKLSETNLQARIEDFFGPATLVRTQKDHPSQRVRKAVDVLLGRTPTEGVSEAAATKKPRKPQPGAANAKKRSTKSSKSQQV